MNKTLRKEIKAMSRFFDLQDIKSNRMDLKNGEKIIGIKVKPFDIWTARVDQSNRAINTIRFALNNIDFKVYHSIISTDADFSTFTDEMIEDFDILNDYQRAIIYDDIEKNELFMRNHKNVEFFLMIKGKNFDLLQKQYEVLHREFSRFFVVEQLNYLDYVNYIEWLFDIPTDIITKGFFNGKEFLVNEYSTDKNGSIIIDNIDKNDTYYIQEIRYDNKKNKMYGEVQELNINSNNKIIFNDDDIEIIEDSVIDTDKFNLEVIKKENGELKRKAEFHIWQEPCNQLIERKNNKKGDLSTYRSFENLYRLNTVKEHSNYFEVNDTYYRVILIQQTPNIFELGLFNTISQNKKNKLLWLTERSDLDLSKHLNKQYESMLESHRKASRDKNLNEKNRLEKELNSLQEYSKGLTSSRDQTLNLSAMMLVKSHSKEELKHETDTLIDTLRNGFGFEVYVPSHLQIALLKHLTPLFEHDKLLNKNLEFNVGFPIATTDYALTYPYHFDELLDKNGFLYGYEINMGGRIIFNPFLYMEDEKNAVSQGRLNGNMILGGESGSGKTTDLFLIIRYLLRTNTFLMWIDPENTNKDYVLSNGGSYLDFGSDQYMFNLFQLRRVSIDDEIEDDEERKRVLWNTEQAIITAIDDFKNVLLLYTQHIDDSALNMVGTVAEHMYREKGVSQKETFEDLKNTDFPTLSDFNDSLMEHINVIYAKNEKFKSACEDLSLKIAPMLAEHRFLFDGHTTTNIELKAGNMVGIGTKSLFNKSQNLQNALYYIICSQAFNFCLDTEVKSAFIYDEAHTILSNNDIIIGLIDQFTRRSRKYFNLCILATQEWADFDDRKMSGIINNSNYIIIKKTTKENALTTLEKLVGIEQHEKENIRDFEQGDSFIKLGDEKFYVHTLLTDTEKKAKGGNY